MDLVHKNHNENRKEWKRVHIYSKLLYNVDKHELPLDGFIYYNEWVLDLIANKISWKDGIEEYINSQINLLYDIKVIKKERFEKQENSLDFQTKKGL